MGPQGRPCSDCVTFETRNGTRKIILSCLASSIQSAYPLVSGFDMLTTRRHLRRWNCKLRCLVLATMLYMFRFVTGSDDGSWHKCTEEAYSSGSLQDTRTCHVKSTVCINRNSRLIEHHAPEQAEPLLSDVLSKLLITDAWERAETGHFPVSRHPAF